MKTIKMLLYGEPGVGKSVFANGSDKPFFITTDGNYEWLEDFGAKPEDHIQVYSWEEAKKAFEQSYDNYNTIVVDLVEDLFKWCEQEYCTKSRIDHISDIGFGKGYDITRNEFFLEISKLLSKPKNVILISHGITFTTKDRRGVEHTKYAPSSRIPDKVWDMIEGRLRYCLRCYCKAEETKDGQLIKTRWLSIVPKENEFGIARGVDESKIPHDIPLDWNEFIKCIGIDNKVITNSGVKVDIQKIEIKEQSKEAEKAVEETKTMTVTEANPMPFDEPNNFMSAQEDDFEQTTNVETKVETTVEPKVEQKAETQPQQTEMSNADKLAAIKAKLAALKNKQ